MEVQKYTESQLISLLEDLDYSFKNADGSFDNDLFIHSATILEGFKFLPSENLWLG